MHSSSRPIVAPTMPRGRRKRVLAAWVWIVGFCLAALIARDAPGRVYAYGDSRADLAHMQLVQEAYLVNASPRLAERQAQVQAIHWHQRGGI